MTNRTMSAKIAWVICYLVAGLLGGWAGYLVASPYWEWRMSEDSSTDPLEIAASFEVSIAGGAILVMCALWFFYDRPVRQAHRRERLRLGPSRHQHRSHA